MVRPMNFENNEKYKFNWGRETHGVKTVNNSTILISYIIQLIELMWKEKFKFPVNSSLILNSCFLFESREEQTIQSF